MHIVTQPQIREKRRELNKAGLLHAHSTLYNGLSHLPRLTKKYWATFCLSYLTQNWSTKQKTKVLLGDLLYLTLVNVLIVITLY